MSTVLDNTITGSQTDRGMYAMFLSLAALAGGVYSINTILGGNLNSEQKRNTLAYVISLGIFVIVTAFFTNLTEETDKDTSAKIIKVEGIPEFTNRKHWLYKEAPTLDGTTTAVTDKFGYTFLQRNVIHIFVSMAIALIATKQVIKRLK